jgi:hypothetical protein
MYIVMHLEEHYEGFFGVMIRLNLLKILYFPV